MNFVIFRTMFGSIEWLRLSGPFAYPEWTASVRKATPMSLARSCVWLEAVRGPDSGDPQAVPLDSPMFGGTVSPIATVEAVPTTRRMGSESDSEEFDVNVRNKWGPYG